MQRTELASPRQQPVQPTQKPPQLTPCSCPSRQRADMHRVSVQHACSRAKPCKSESLPQEMAGKRLVTMPGSAVAARWAADTFVLAPVGALAGGAAGLGGACPSEASPQLQQPSACGCCCPQPQHTSLLTCSSFLLCSVRTSSSQTPACRRPRRLWALAARQLQL